MRANHVLIDFENVQVRSIDLLRDEPLRKKKIFCTRSASIEEMPCFAKDNGKVQSAAVATKNDDPASSRDVQSDREALVTIVLEDLAKRKAAMPRSEKTLRSTIQARCGKQVPTAEIDAIYAVLLARGHVRNDGSRLVYELAIPARS